eukprot:symbB.v1.2.021942.t1/scaffold1929.1/size95800/6
MFRPCVPFLFGALGFALILVACGGSLNKETIRSTVTPEAQFEMSTRSGTLKDPASYEAIFFLPEVVDAKLPLLLYLHGAGEMRGELHEIISEGATGTPPVELSYGRAPKTLSQRFAVVAPHTSQGWSLEAINRFMDFLLADKSLNLDPTRLYVTGHSMGGAGALLAATSHRFAAAVPVAASGAPRASSVQGVPIWAFHGSNDVIVPSVVSKDLIEALWNAGASKDDVKLTLYEDAPAPPGWPDYFGHASTIPAYATLDLYDWLLQHHLDK